MKWGTVIPVLFVGVMLSEAQAYHQSEETRPAQTTQQLDSSESWSKSRIDTTFEFSNGKRVCLDDGWLKIEDGNQRTGGFYVRDCDTNEKLGGCESFEGCHVLFSNDTLWVNQLELLAMGENLDLVYFPWIVSAFYLEDGSFKYTERLNENLRYDEQTIESILKEYETTDWRTQEEDAEYVGFQLMPLASKLMIAAISGSQESEMKFKEFRTRAKLDGAYASWYLIMERILAYTKSN